MEILCFFAGVAFVHSKQAYPLLLLLLAFFFRPSITLIGWFCMAIVFSLSHEWWIADSNMPAKAIINNALLEGTIESIPIQQGNKTQFQFRVSRLDGVPAKTRILLNCYDHCPALKAKQHWCLKAKIKKPQNFANPGGFDYVSWLQAKHIHWIGQVRRGSFKWIVSPHAHYYLLTWREHLADSQAQMDNDPKTLGIFQALSLGITSHILKEDWDLFRHTGTTHLMVISGAHIGLVAGLTYWFVKWLWRFFPRGCLIMPAPKIASILAILMAFIYALIAGFAVPAQRSLIACFFVFIRHFCNRRFSVWQGWRYALLVVLALEPHAVMMPGFYLSFLAVACLLLVNQRLSFKGLVKTIAMQLACLLGLMPLTLYWFSYGAVNGLFANLIAVPWVGFIIVPLALLCTLLGQWMVPSWIVLALHESITYLLKYLHWVDSFANFNVTFTFTELLTPISLMLAMLIVLFMPIRQFILIVGLLAPASLIPAHEKVKSGEVRIDVLDVGQGLAVIVNTAKHILIYDTGAKFYKGSDMGKIAIIPYLNTLGIRHIDTVVISHSDLDHRGGLLSLEATYPIGELIVDDPTFYKRGANCHRYKDWSWDDVSFRFFAIKAPLLGKNNHSCVLQVATKSSKMLLSGDIETIAENYLTTTYGKELQSSILLVPHHGSKTSSSSEFVAQVAPSYAIISAGFDNRYHFPHAKALQAYQQASIYNTAECGMIRILLGAKTPLLKPKCFR